MTAKRLFLTNWASNQFSGTLVCEVWFDDGAGHTMLVADLRIGDDGVGVEFSEYAFGDMMLHLPLTNGLDFTKRVIAALDAQFDAACETYEDCFRDGDITVLEMQEEAA
jgi:hypothetical protein